MQQSEGNELLAQERSIKRMNVITMIVAVALWAVNDGPESLVADPVTSNNIIFGAAVLATLGKMLTHKVKSQRDAKYKDQESDTDNLA